MSRLSPTVRGGLLGAVAGVLVAVILFVAAHFAFDLDITTGQDQVKIPRGLTGQRFDTAIATLRSMGLTNVRAPGAGYAFGTATKVQTVVPPAGTEVDKDSMVTLISKVGKH